MAVPIKPIEVAISPNMWKWKQSTKWENKKVFQKIRKQDKTSEKDFNNMEINNITEKEFKMS